MALNVMFSVSSRNSEGRYLHLIHHLIRQTTSSFLNFYFSVYLFLNFGKQNFNFQDF